MGAQEAGPPLLREVGGQDRYGYARCVAGDDAIRPAGRVQLSIDLALDSFVLEHGFYDEVAVRIVLDCLRYAQVLQCECFLGRLEEAPGNAFVQNSFPVPGQPAPRLFLGIGNDDRFACECEDERNLAAHHAAADHPDPFERHLSSPVHPGLVRFGWVRS
jgi:hypothetical protein